MGRIGQAIGRRLEASRVPVVYHSRKAAEGVSYKHYPDLIEMAKAVDTLIVIVPGGAATAKMINADVMKALGPRGVIINVARGSVVDEPALISALKSGTILAAGLDVFANEPAVPDELRAMQNVVLLPHIGSASVVTRNAMDQLVVDNLKAWFARQAAADAGRGNPGEGPLMTGRPVMARLGIRCAAWYRCAVWRCARGAAGADRRRPVARAQDASTLKKDMVGQWEALDHRTQQDLRRHAQERCGAAGHETRTRARLRGCPALHQGDHRLERQGTGYRAAAGRRGRGGDRFTEVESGILEGLRQGEGIYILQNLAAARSLAKSMDQMIGDWAMVRSNGQAICGLTLTNTEAGQDNFQVFLKPKCDPAIAAFAPTEWRLEHGQMLLMSKGGEVWHFEADDNAQWRLVPDSADPLIMLRQ